ncbi:MAG: hypothetical protein P0S96_07290 [Simkaniaceae bacterium]|nr:hypothetical protein [Candidatus Sacchlamyda saccharinae]
MADPRNMDLYTRCWKAELDQYADMLSDTGMKERIFFADEKDARLKSMTHMGDTIIKVTTGAFPLGHIEFKELDEGMWSNISPLSKSGVIACDAS